jgi:ribosomal protein S18 acetylase RimI-like enzyme
MRDVIEKTWGWDDAWQRADFDRRFDEYVWAIIEHDERRVGGLLVDVTGDSLYIHELQVLPECQGCGIGTAVVERVIEEAAGRGLPVTLSVVEANPRAKQLYARLGFEVIEFDAPFFRMQQNARAGAWLPRSEL